MLSANSPNSNQKFSMLNFLLQAGEKLTILIPYKALLLYREVRTIKIGKDHIILQVPDQQFCSNYPRACFPGYIQHSTGDGCKSTGHQFSERDHYPYRF